MIETTGKEIIKEILRLIKDKAFIATLIYIICAVLSLLSLFAIILPFSVNMSFMDNVTWKNSLGAGQPLLHTTFALCLINNHCYFRLCICSFPRTLREVAAIFDR